MRRQLFAVWYDLANAFGSIPQQFLWDVLRALQAPDAFISVANDIYQDSSFVVLGPVDAATTAPIRQRRGVYQGCPLSPYLFLAAIEPLLQALAAEPEVGIKLGDNISMNATAFADDIKIFSSTETGIEKLHALVVKYLRWTSL
ncbi:polyprotein [Phytophthora megakarya]|uniref:Polyprotein n=1 Tax=Phytophthora megakarya TaxID=4795 RepID=A0A225V4J9_9STRA|nr:polyprotein [Phytophthora megakarya]